MAVGGAPRRLARGGPASAGASSPRHARAAGQGPPPAGYLGGEQVEGYHAVRQLLLARRRRTRALWAEERSARAGGPVSELCELARGAGAQVALKSAAELALVAETTAPQGVVAWAEPIAAVPLASLLEGLQAGGPAPAVVVLDAVTDPGNLGAVLRSALCAGVGGLIVGRHRSAALSPAALKAAAGAAELLPLCQVPGVPAALASLRAAGLWVVGLSPDATEDLWGSSLLDEPVALVLGSEGRGLSRLARERCDALVRVPMAPAAAGVGSLNVAAACAVACFEVARRRYEPALRAPH